MKLLRMIAIAGAAVLVTAPKVQAQVDFEITPFGGGTFFLVDPPERFAMHRMVGSPQIIDDGTFDDAWTLGIHMGFRVNERWALEGMFSWLPTRLSARAGLAEPVDANGYMYGVTGLFYFPLEGPVHPFVGLGIGAETFDYPQSNFETHTDFMGNVAGGLRIDVVDMIGLRLEARDCFARFKSDVATVDDGWENDLMLTVGLVFSTPVGS